MEDDIDGIIITPADANAFRRLIKDLGMNTPEYVNHDGMKVYKFPSHDDADAFLMLWDEREQGKIL